jgi:folate-binding protein YgfZ
MSQIAEIGTLEGYQAARQSAAFYRVPNPGTLLIRGATRNEYLQRQTTNDLELLSAARVVPSMLTNASGRILEVFTLIQLGEAIALLTQPSHGPGLAAYFKKLIFFNDQVTIEDASQAWAQFELRGPQAAGVLKQLGFATAPKQDELAAAASAERGYAFGIERFDTHLAFMLFVPAATATKLHAQLAELHIGQLSFDARELLRVEAGLPGGPEFNDANTPFEIGLDRYVSAGKGCYTGQEVLARQVTYDKIVRSLAQLSTAQPVAANSAIIGDGKTVGSVSSVAVSPDRGPLGLAVLRKPYQEPGTLLSVGSIPATVL